MAKKSEVTILRDHLKERHQELYGINYVCNNFAMEGRMLKTFISQHGYDVAERFVDACFKEYKPTTQYPGLNFGFMYSYMRERVLPKVLADIAKEERRESEPEQDASSQDMSQEDFENFI